MAFFDCVSDFVDSKRDLVLESTDRLLLLKPNFTEAVKREQQTRTCCLQTNNLHPSISFLVSQKPESTVVVSSSSDAQNPFRSLGNEIDRLMLDRSSFVPLDFQYKSIEYTSNESFHGFLGDVENPWNLHIGNIQFIPKRDRMMAELQ